jgi:bla regulator protein BlaR1
MIQYLLETSGCLLLALSFYKLVLEAAQMARFKRFYLLGSLLVSALQPLLSLEVNYAALAPVSAGTYPPVRSLLASTATGPVAVSPQPFVDLFQYVGLLYGLVTFLVVSRFCRNLWRLTRQIAAHPHHAFHEATLVELPLPGLPYTFLHYLFVPATAYRQGQLEAEVLTHELAHVRQYHSLDILLLEVLLCVGWFNPLLYWLKRAVQLNHEFLADEAVNQQYHNVLQYQQLLLSKLTGSPQPALTSALTFQITKQRLLMMTTHTSRPKQWLLGGSTAGWLAMLTVLFGTTAAQVPPLGDTAGRTTGVPQRPASHPSAAEEESVAKRYGNCVLTLPSGQQKRYKDLSAAERKSVVYLPLSPRRTPTAAQWAAWHNPHQFGVWVDGKRLRGPALHAYQRTDIVAFSGSYVHKNARQPEGYTYQLDLTTESSYQAMVKEHETSPFVVVSYLPRPKATSARGKQGKL